MKIVILEDAAPAWEQTIYLTRGEHDMYRREYDALTHMVDRPSFEVWLQGRHMGSLQNLPLRTKEWVHSVAPGVWLNTNQIK